MALCCSVCVVSPKLCGTRHFAQGLFMFVFFIPLLWSCPERWRRDEVVERVTLDMPKAARSIGGDDHNQFAMSSKSPCRVVKERTAPFLLLEDSTVTQNSPGIAQPEIEAGGREEPSQILSLQITVNYWFWYLLSQAQRMLLFLCLQSCFSPWKSLRGQCTLSGWWHPLKFGVLDPSCHILHLPKAPNFI